MRPQNTTENEIRQFCTFDIAGRLFGVKVTDVKEIHPVVMFTPVFHASEDVKGFVNIRGQVHLVIDLRVLLGFESKSVDELSQILLFKPHVGDSFGVLVDRIGDVVEMERGQIERLGDEDRRIREKDLHHFSGLVEGICKQENGLLVILNSSDLLAKIEKKHKK